MGGIVGTKVGDRVALTVVGARVVGVIVGDLVALILVGARVVGTCVDTFLW